MPPFDQDEGLIYLYDIISKTYGCLPSDVARLSWSDLLICARCIWSRSVRMKRAMKSGGKKAMLFPTIPISDLIDIM